MSPEISIIVPVYKGIRFLREALDSVKVQTFRDWECVCIDDGSKDGSGTLLDRLTADDPRFRVFHRANGGTSVARNFALSVARGRYVAFLDEDDIYHPRLLEVLYMAAERLGTDVTGCEFVKFPEDGHPQWSENVPDDGDWRVAADRAAVAEWAAGYYEGIPFEIWRNLYRREILAGHEFPPGVRVEQDLYWQYTLLPQMGSYARVNWQGYAWRASSIGGFLHPDPESLISLTRTDRIILKTMHDSMGFSESQMRRFKRQMSHFLYYCIWRPLHGGVELDHVEFGKLRDGLEILRSEGVCLRGYLGLRQRLCWMLFMRTGRVSWVRSTRRSR